MFLETDVKKVLFDNKDTLFQGLTNGDEHVKWLITQPHYMDIINGFVDAAYILKKSNPEHGSVSLIIEFLRWQTAVGEREGVFKINNRYKSILSRLIPVLDPNFKDYFVTRQKPSENV